VLTTSVLRHPSLSFTSTTLSRRASWPTFCAPLPPTATATTRTSGGRAAANTSTPSSGVVCVRCCTRRSVQVVTTSMTGSMTGGELMERAYRRYHPASRGCHGATNTCPTCSTPPTTANGPTMLLLSFHRTYKFALLIVSPFTHPSFNLILCHHGRSQDVVIWR